MDYGYYIIWPRNNFEKEVWFWDKLYPYNFLDDEDDEFIRLKTLSEAKKILKTVDEPDAQIVLHTFCMYCMREQFIYGKKAYKKVFVCEKCNTEQAISI